MKFGRSTIVFFVVVVSTTLPAGVEGSPDNFFRPVISTARSLSSSLTKTIPAIRFHNESKDGRVVNAAVKAKRAPGFYYGLSEAHVQTKPAAPKKPSLSSVMEDTLDEIKTMRKEMERLRKELRSMKRSMGGADMIEEDEGPRLSSREMVLARRKRARDFDKIGLEVERWAEKLLFEEKGNSEFGWKEVKCNPLFRRVFNKEGEIKCYMKYMPDSRGKDATLGNEKEYPCIKVYTTIDAPIDDVCAYLSEEQRLPEYNDLVVRHRQLEEISPHSMISWGQSPKIMMIKPRDFVTFCHHRWLRDGTQVVVNQAVDHPDVPATAKETAGKPSRAYAIRGANFISPHPDDPNKTRFAIVAHAHPGGELPPMMIKTAVNALAPIEPFKLFHKINHNVKRAQPELQVSLVNAKASNQVSAGRSPRPAGLSQMGYACFWPKGGGLREGVVHSNHPDHGDPDEDDELETLEE